MGTPDFAVPSLTKLAQAEDVEVPLVLTRPDAVRGRGRRLEPSAVKAQALELGICVHEAKRIGEAELAAIAEAAPDAIAVAAYGAIIPDALLTPEAARLGVVNVHGSLLPRWRGAAPIQRAILAGDERIGISIMRIVHDLDAGPWCRQASVEAAGKGAVEVMAELAELGADELLLALRELDAGVAVWHEQDEALVTYAHKVEKAEMALTPDADAEANLRRVLASTDAAPARCVVAGRGLRVCAARLAEVGELEALPGGAPVAGAVATRRGHVYLGCAEGVLEPLVVRPDGKREMDASAWAAGLRGELSWGA
jgi:methionyl-tRNA formyltransferase